jgi:hypothetical protein
MALALVALDAVGILAQPLNFDVLAGSPPSAGDEDGPATVARFAVPGAVAVDATGNAYVADAGNHAIRRISPSGEVTTLAGLAASPGDADGRGGMARFDTPLGVAVDVLGNVIVADRGNRTIRRVTPAGLTTTLAGTTGLGVVGDGPARLATFVRPLGVAVAADGNVFVTEYLTCELRRIDARGTVATVAGAGCGAEDGPAGTGTLRQPAGVAVDEATGDVIVADSGNHAIRRVTPDGTITTVAGSLGVPGGDDGRGTDARFNLPWEVAVDAAGNIWVADSGNATVRRVAPDGTVTTVAGTAGMRGHRDGTGALAEFRSPQGVAIEPSGNLLVADAGNNDVRRVDLPSGVVTRVAGTPPEVGRADGSGVAARFDSPTGMVRDGELLVVADRKNNAIRRVTLDGVVNTLAGGTSGSMDGSGAAAQFRSPEAVAADGSGVVFVADTDNSTIRRIDAAGNVTLWAGWQRFLGADDGVGTDARFRFPRGIVADAMGNVRVIDTENHTIRRIDPAQVVTTVLGAARTAGHADGAASDARFFYPFGGAVDADGGLWIADRNNHVIRHVAPDGSVTTVAGRPGVPGSVDGSGADARFRFPEGVHVTPAGDVLVGDSGNGLLRRVMPDGVVTTIAGHARAYGSGPGTGRHARFGEPRALVADGGGALLLADADNHAIRAASLGLVDEATIDAAWGAVGELRRLDVLPRTATAWAWRIVRRPTGSVAEISDPSVPDPTFVPDRDDVYTFEATASDGASSSTTRVTLTTGRGFPVIARAVGPAPARGREGQLVVLHVQALAAPVELAFSDGSNPTIPVASLVVDTARGLVAARVPAGARTGSLRLRAGGVDAPPFVYTVETGAFDRGARSVGGRVTGQAGPVVGAVVLLRRIETCGDPAAWDAAVTDASGAYALTGPDGAHVLDVFPPVPLGLAATRAAVVLGDVPITRDVALDVGTLVAGSVASASTGDPVPDVRVELDGPAGEVALSSLDGRFSASLQPGAWRLAAVPPVSVALRTHETGFEVASTVPLDLGRIVLGDGLAVRGRVTRWADGSPLVSVRISARRTSPCCDDAGETYTRGDGTYLLTVPELATYELAARPDADGGLAQHVESRDLHFGNWIWGMRLVAASTISGRVTDGATGAPVACVEIRAAPLPGTPVASAWSCSDGTYRLDLPASAGYRVSTTGVSDAACGAGPAWAAQSWNGSPGGTWFSCEATWVTVPAAGGSVPGIDFALTRAVTLEGTVVTRGSGCAMPDPTVDPTRVTVDDGLMHACSMGEHVAAAEPGAYRIEHLPPSTATTLRACLSAPPSAAQCFDDRAAPAFDPIVALPGEVITGIDFCLGTTMAPTQPLGGVRVRKEGVELVLTWQPSVDPAHASYRVRASQRARPTVMPGTFPSDPPFADLTLADRDGDPTNPELRTLLLVTAGYFLVSDVGWGGEEGPSGHYGP